MNYKSILIAGIIPFLAGCITVITHESDLGPFFDPAAETMNVDLNLYSALINFGIEPSLDTGHVNIFIGSTTHLGQTFEGTWASSNSTWEGKLEYDGKEYGFKLRAKAYLGALGFLKDIDIEISDTTLVFLPFGLDQSGKLPLKLFDFKTASGQYTVNMMSVGAITYINANPKDHLNDTYYQKEILTKSVQRFGVFDSSSNDLVAQLQGNQVTLRKNGEDNLSLVLALAATRSLVHAQQEITSK